MICCGALDGIRTHTERILSPLPLPIGLQGHMVAWYWNRTNFVSEYESDKMPYLPPAILGLLKSCPGLRLVGRTILRGEIR